MLLQHLASSETATESESLFDALGLDPQLFIVQILSFLILLALLSKFVYPALLRAIDERREKIDASVRAAEEAKVAAEKAEEKTEKEFGKAKKEAAGIVETAQAQAAQLVSEAEERANKRAEHLIASAQTRMDQEVAQARQALRAEMVELVAAATEKVLRQKLDPTTDTALIKRAIEEAK